MTRKETIQGPENGPNIQTPNPPIHSLEQTIEITPEILAIVLSFRKRCGVNLDADSQQKYERYLSKVLDFFSAKQGLKTAADGFQYGVVSSTVDKEPKSNYSHYFENSLAKVAICTNAGGPKSKYKVNEDNYFALSATGMMGVGVIDGAGGSHNGLLASQVAIAGFSVSIQKSSLPEMFAQIGELIERHANDGYVQTADLKGYMPINAGYATGVVARVKLVDGQKIVETGSSGDSRILTLRQGPNGFYKLPEGTTTPQNSAQQEIDAGLKRPESIYTSNRAFEITGALGIPRGECRAPDFATFTAQKDDLMFLYSDGGAEISEYEYIQIANTYSDVRELQKIILNLSLYRNNTPDEFTIQHSENCRVPKRISSHFFKGKSYECRGGDNISVAVVRL